MSNSGLKTKNKNARLATIFVVRVAFMSALLTALKFALSFVPNVEVVTLLVLVYGACFGVAYALPATLIFCAVEVAIYGVGSWVPLYFVYWPMLAVVGSLLLRGRRVWLAIIIASIGSILFGVLSACCDTLFCIANLAPVDISKYWVAYYIRGLTFDAIHLATNIMLILFAYKPLVAVCARFAPINVYSSKIPRKILTIPHRYVRGEEE